MTIPAGAEGFADAYSRALEAFRRHRGESELNDAYELGRRALAAGMGLLEIVAVHLETLAAAIPAVQRDGLERDRIDADGRFLTEALSPFAMLHLANREANSALRRLNDILEEDARRIAHALHDDAAQILATTYLELAELEREAPPALGERVRRVTAQLDEIRRQLRQFSHELRPPVLDQLGLVPALRFLAASVEKRSGLEVVVEGTTSGRLSRAIETTLYRAAQEALNNVVAHADARYAQIRVRRDRSTVYCTVTDDGKGVDGGADVGAPKGLGLIGIRERIGALQGAFSIGSRAGGGAELRIAVPLERR